VLREESGQRHAAVVGEGVAAGRIAGVVVEVDDPRGVDRRADGGDAAVGEDADVVHAVRVERRHGASCGRPEADHDGAQPPPVVTGRAAELQGVQHRAVAGELVVLVEDVQAERAVGGPVVHRLEGDERQPPFHGQLRELLVLDAVRPAPQHLTFAQLRDVVGDRLEQQDDVALRDELLA
jgi:hypothetical protein